YRPHGKQQQCQSRQCVAWRVEFNIEILTVKSSKDFIDRLKGAVAGDVLDDDYSLGMYATDASVYQIRPVAVVIPKSEDDVHAAIRLARDHEVTILPRGGGTSLAGQTVGHSMVIDFSKYMNQILEVNATERWVRVQPGMIRDDLNEQLKPYNLHFAPE